MKVIRTQWPVGQGCFSSGIIDREGPKPIHYVYDCGARNVTRARKVASNYAERIDKLDALFVSHLDGDHVDGLDTLLATLSPTDVYLPYLDPADRLAAVMEAQDEERLTATLERAVLDPAGWFGERGAANVIFVRNDGDALEGGFMPPGGRDGGPREDLLGGDVPRDETPLELKRLGAVRIEDRDSPSEANTDRPAVLEMKVGGCLAAGRRGSAEWLLVPFVSRVDPAATSAFRDRVRTVLGLSEDDVLTGTAILDKLKTHVGRRDLRGCYEEILNGGATSNYNKVSMSLYSGAGRYARLMRVARQRHHLYDERWWGLRLDSDRPGWVGTGDAKLKTKRRRREWADFYKHVTDLVGTFVLPHHGSKKNWHRDLLDVTGADLYVASSDDPAKGYEHPSESVMLDIEDAVGRGLAIVTAKPGSRLVERVEFRGATVPGLL